MQILLILKFVWFFFVNFIFVTRIKLYIHVSLWVLQDVEIDEEVDVIISEWMGYMLLYEVHIRICLIFHSRYIF